jgi:hypothetical protein
MSSRPDFSWSAQCCFHQPDFFADTLKEAQILTADWRRLYNALRPHSSLGQRPPAPETIVWQGFRLTDIAPPSPTPEASMALT